MTFTEVMYTAYLISVPIKLSSVLCDKKGIDSTKIKSIDMAEMKEREYDRLADTVRESLDMDLIYKIINKEV